MKTFLFLRVSKFSTDWTCKHDWVLIGESEFLHGEKRFFIATTTKNLKSLTIVWRMDAPMQWGRMRSMQPRTKKILWLKIRLKNNTIPTKFHQNLSKNQWKEFQNNQFCKMLPKNVKKIDETFLKYWGLSGAKACKSCRSRQELSNEYLLAKFGVDTEENEPYNVCSFGWKIRVRFDVEPFN